MPKYYPDGSLIEAENNGVVAIYRSEDAVQRIGGTPTKCLVFGKPDHPNISLMTGTLDTKRELLAGREVARVGHYLPVPLSTRSLAEGDDEAADLIREANLYVGQLREAVDILGLKVAELVGA